MEKCSERHELQIMRYVVSKFCKLRLHAYAKSKTIEYLGEKATMNASEAVQTNFV